MPSKPPENAASPFPSHGEDSLPLSPYQSPINICLAVYRESVKKTDRLMNFEEKENFCYPNSDQVFVPQKTAYLKSKLYPFQVTMLQRLPSLSFSDNQPLRAQRLVNQASLGEVIFIIISSMGGSESVLPGRSFKEQEWESAPLGCFTRLKDPYYGSNFKVLMNRLNRGLEVEQYDLTFTANADYQAYCTHLDWRASSNFLIAPKYIRQVKDSAFCSTFQYASVFFERTPVRLYQIQDISLEEGLYILYASVQGFERLFEQFGYFQIESDLICFSREGLVRVWANRNLSKCLPERPTNHPAHPYSTFFNKLLSLLEKLIDFEGKPTLSQFMQRKRLKQPLHNLLGVLELYIKEVGMVIPRYLASIRNLCSGRKRSKSRAYIDSSHVFSSNCPSANSHQKNANDAPYHPNLYHSPPSSLNTPFRRSHQLNVTDLHPRKRFSFVQPVPLQKPPPSITFTHSANADSPKNVSYSTQEDVFLKSKIYSALDAEEQSMRRKSGMRMGSSYLQADNLDMDPQIAADMLKMAQSSF